MNSLEIDISKTPKFDKPPVVETVLGVQFRPLHNMQITHYGKFHDLLKAKGLDQVQQHPRLEHHIEQKQSVMRLMAFPVIMQLPRLWFHAGNSNMEQLIQFQNDRLLQNWRTQSPGDATYPSYKKNRREFHDTLLILKSFTDDNGLGNFLPDQCEVTYVNRIPMADFSNPQEAFRQCFTISLPNQDLPHVPSSPESLSCGWAYWNDTLNGRLHIQASTMTIIGTAGRI